MYSSYLLAIFFLLGTGIAANRLTNPAKGKNDVLQFQATLHHHQNTSITITNLGMTPDQMYDFEYALNSVVTRLLGPQERKFSLRSSENENTGIIYTIKALGDAIFRQIKRLFEALGLIPSTKPDSPEDSEPDEPNFKSTVYHQLLSIPLKLSPYWYTARTHLRSHFQRRNYHKMGYKKANFELVLGPGISTDQMKISAIVGTIAMYGTHFYNCLESKEPSSFDLKQKLGNMTSSSPEVTGRQLKSRLQRPILRCPNKNKENYNQYHAFACLALADNLKSDYYACLVEVKRVDKCVHNKISKTEVKDSVMKSAKSSKGSGLNMKSLDICNFVDCKTKLKSRKRNVFPDVILYFVGDAEKSPKLRRMANRLGSMITRSRMGSEALDEVANFIDIYKNGQETKARLMKAAQKDPRQRSFFARISNVLQQYRQYILDMTYKTVLHVNTAMIHVQKVLVESASKLVGQDLAPHFQTYKCWSKWVKSVMFEWSHERGRFPNGQIAQRTMNSEQGRNGSERSKLKSLIKAPNEVGFIKSPHEEPLNELIVSMKSLGRPSKPRRSNALVSLANTFLLATMFYECISLLAGAIYYDDSSSMSPTSSAENDDRWQSSRDKRSSPPEDFRPQGEHGQTKPLFPTTEMVLPTVTTVKPVNDEPQENLEDSPKIPVPGDPEEPEEPE